MASQEHAEHTHSAFKPSPQKSHRFYYAQKVASDSNKTSSLRKQSPTDKNVLKISASSLLSTVNQQQLRSSKRNYITSLQQVSRGSPGCSNHSERS